jgi:hypothetical protein
LERDVIDKLEADVTRANQARALLSNAMLNDAFETLRASYLKAWETTKYNDTDGRERLWQAIQIVGLVRGQLEAYVNDGKLAQVEIDRANYGLRDRPAA